MCVCGCTEADSCHDIIGSVLGDKRGISLLAINTVLPLSIVRLKFVCNFIIISST